MQEKDKLTDLQVDRTIPNYLDGRWRILSCVTILTS